jgi:hypothetical protein
MLVQEVVDLPALVRDPDVVAILGHDVVEQHEVGDEDLVHPAPRLKAVQVVLRRFGLEVRRLRGEVDARGVHALALPFEHPCHRVLSEPVDLEPGHLRPQLARDREVSLGVAQPDRRGDEQRAFHWLMTLRCSPCSEP